MDSRRNQRISQECCQMNKSRRPIRRSDRPPFTKICSNNNRPINVHSISQNGTVRVNKSGIIVTDCFNNIDSQQQIKQSILKRSSASESVRVDSARRSVSFSSATSVTPPDHQLSPSFSTPNSSPSSLGGGGGILRLSPESMKLLEQNCNLRNSMRSNQNLFHSKAICTISNLKSTKNVDCKKGLIDNLSQLVDKMKNGHFCHSDVRIDSCRQKVLVHYREMILSNLSNARKASALQTIWQKCFYLFINHYRDQLKKTINLESKRKYIDQLLAIISEGTDFFSSLIEKLQFNYYNFTYGSLVERYKHRDCNSILFSHLQEVTFCLKDIFVYLGDLERYGQSVMDKPNFEQAKRFYMKAHLLTPKYAHASSQLGMINHYQKDCFNAIYYYVRTFETDSQVGSENSVLSPTASSVPFTTRHENKQILTVLFDSVKHNGYEEMVEKLKSDHRAWVERTKPQRDRILEGNSQINTYDRIEYWVSPGVKNAIAKCDMHNFYDLASIKANKAHLDLLHYYREKVLPNMLFSEVKTRFIQSFLMAHGMLNCRNGLDRYYDVVNQMLVEFDCLLNRRYRLATTDHLSSFFMFQLLIINMYTISNTVTEDIQTKHASQYSFTHKNAYFIMSSMLMLICRRLIGLFDVFRREHDRLVELQAGDGKKAQAKCINQKNLTFENEDQFAFIEEWFEMFSNDPSFSELSNPDLKDLMDFFRLLPTVKIWADWVRSWKLHFPPQNMCELNIQVICPKLADDNVWHVFARLLSLFDQLKTFPVTFVDKHDEINNRKDDYELVQLPEVQCLEGFKLIAVNCTGKYVKRQFVQKIPYIYLRIESIRQFGVHLCERKYLRFNSEKSQFESQINKEAVEPQNSGQLSTCDKSLNAFEEYVKLRQEFGFKDIKNEDDDLIFDCEDDFEDALDVGIERLNLNNGGIVAKNDKILIERKRRFIIRPRYVIFDTNCFINDFDSIQHFIRTSPFLVIIPLIVIHELEYIQARGQRIATELADNPESDLLKSFGRGGVAIKPEKIANHLEISKKAGEILDFLKNAFVQHKSNVRAITSKGSLLKSFDYKEEFYDPNAFNNDDLVLYACTNLIKQDKCNNGHSNEKLKKLLEDAGEFVSHQDEYIYRDVILITDDFNLRLKSLCFEVPVKRLKQFLRWMRTF